MQSRSYHLRANCTFLDVLNSWFVVLSLWVSIKNKSKFKNTSKANLSIFVVTLRPFDNLIECFDFLSKLNEVCYSGCSEQEQRTARKKKWTTRTELSRSHYFNSIQKVHLNIYITLLYALWKVLLEKSMKRLSILWKSRAITAVVLAYTSVPQLEFRHEK